jgi:hypothetical protein
LATSADNALDYIFWAGRVVNTPKRTRSGRRPDAALFPSAWPWRAWFAFHDAMLASLYVKNTNLWQLLREDCRHVTGYLQHLEYEAEIASEGSFGAVTSLIPGWTQVEGRLELARNLLGRNTWSELTRKAGRTYGPGSTAS